MYVLILEDDELIGDLLETVVAGAYPGAVIRLYTLVQSAISSWQKHPADLVVVDWNLPDGSGLELIRAVR
ncbi:MAG: response regulator, partial [Marinobacter sp.]